MIISIIGESALSFPSMHRYDIITKQSETAKLGDIVVVYNTAKKSSTLLPGICMYVHEDSWINGTKASSIGSNVVAILREKCQKRPVFSALPNNPGVDKFSGKAIILRDDDQTASGDIIFVSDKNGYVVHYEKLSSLYEWTPAELATKRWSGFNSFPGGCKYTIVREMMSPGDYNYWEAVRSINWINNIEPWAPSRGKMSFMGKYAVKTYAWLRNPNAPLIHGDAVYASFSNQNSLRLKHAIEGEYGTIDTEGPAIANECGWGDGKHTIKSLSEYLGGYLNVFRDESALAKGRSRAKVSKVEALPLP